MIKNYKNASSRGSESVTVETAVDSQLATENQLLVESCCQLSTSSLSFPACNSQLRSAICQHHPPQRAVLIQICCFGERKVVLFQL